MADAVNANPLLVDIADAMDKAPTVVGGPTIAPKKARPRSSKDVAIKRRCVSTACIACRRRKSKCDGNTPSCAACSSVYRTGELDNTLALIF
jgi:hypothetical protein